MMEHTGVTMRGQEHEQGRVEGVSPTEFMGVKIRVKISRGDMSFDRYTLYSLEADLFKNQLNNYEKHQRGCLREVRVRIKLPGPCPALTHLPAVHPDPA